MDTERAGCGEEMEIEEKVLLSKTEKPASPHSDCKSAILGCNYVFHV